MEPYASMSRSWYLLWKIADCDHAHSPQIEVILSIQVLQENVSSRKSILGLHYEADIAHYYLAKCLTCAKVRFRTSETSGFVGTTRDTSMEVDKSRWILSQSSKSSQGYGPPFGNRDRLTKSAIFIPMKETDPLEKLAIMYLNEVVTRHGIPVSIICDRDPRFASNFWRSLQKALGTSLDMSTDISSATDGQSELHPLRHFSTVETCRFACLWAEVGEVQSHGPRLYKRTTGREKIMQPWKGLVLANEEVNHRVRLGPFKKCHADEPLAVPLDGLHFDDKLQFVEEPIEITDREVKRLKRSRIPLVKVRWNSKRGPEFTWEREDQFRKKYPHLFSKTGPSSSAAS
ncbi:putative reverse transcriptase domain-containing protein [Tanacetum coccineum]